MTDHSVSKNATPENLAAESRELSRSSFAAILGVLLSRFSGLIRQQVVTAMFGAGMALDAFFLAYRFPSALRDLFAEGALSAAFTKTYVEVRARSAEEARQLVATVTVFFGVVTLFLAGLGVIYARHVIDLMSDKSYAQTPGYEIAVDVFRYLVFYLPIAMLSASAMSILTVLRKTFRATVASAFFNVGTIIGAAVGAPLLAHAGMQPIKGLVFGTLAGGILQFLYQVWPLLRSGLFPNPLIAFHTKINLKPLFEILRLMGPRVLAQGASSIALVINTNFATLVGVGALVYISNAQTLVLVPIGLFGVAAGIASAPVLSQAVVDGNRHKFSRLLSESLSSTQWLGLITIIGFALLIFPTTVVLFQHGRYTRFDALQTALAIHAYGAAIFFNASSKVLQPAFFAFGHTRQVAVNAFIYLFLNATLSYLLAPRLGIVGLGISNSISAAGDFFLSYLFLKRLARKKNFVDEQGLLYVLQGKDMLARVFIFSLIAFVSIGVGIVLTKAVWHPATEMLRWWQLGILLLCGGGLYLLVALWLTKKCGPKTLAEQVDRIAHKMHRWAVKIGLRKS